MREGGRTGETKGGQNGGRKKNTKTKNGKQNTTHEHIFPKIKQGNNQTKNQNHDGS